MLVNVPVSVSVAVAVSAAQIEVARLTRVLISWLRLAFSGVGLARHFACALAAAAPSSRCP